MCAATVASLLTSEGSCSGGESERNSLRLDCVARKPRHRKLSATSGSKTIARKKSPCAGRSNALNRRNRSHVSRRHLEQRGIQEPVQKLHQVESHQFRLPIEFRQQI